MKRFLALICAVLIACSSHTDPESYMTLSDRTRRPGPCSTCNRTMPRGECPECWPGETGFDGPDWLYPIAVVAFCAFAGVATRSSSRRRYFGIRGVCLTDVNMDEPLPAIPIDMPGRRLLQARCESVHPSRIGLALLDT
jgi:hypothetical protein